MRPVSTLLSLALVCASTMPTLFAQDEAATTATVQQRDRVELRNGKIKYGSILSYSCETRVLRFQLEDGDEVVYTKQDLHDKTIFRLAASHAPEDDSALQLDTANLARDLGLWKHSGRHYRLALLSAETPQQAKAVYAEVDILSEKAAETMLKEGKRELKARKVSAALDIFEEMLNQLPDQKATAEAGELYTQILNDRAVKRRETRERREAAEVTRALKSPEDDYEKMLEKNRDALLAGSRAGLAEKRFKSAASYGERAIQRLDKLMDHENPEIRSAAEELHEASIDGITDSLVNLGGHYFTYGKYKDSISVCGMALAFDPNDDDAVALRERAQEAQREREELELQQWYMWRYRLLHPGYCPQ